MFPKMPWMERKTRGKIVFLVCGIKAVLINMMAVMLVLN